LAILTTIFEGIANPIPTFPPLLLIIALLIPTRYPALFTRAPPEFPGFIEASVCIKFSCSTIPIEDRLVADMIPWVIVSPTPKGFPRANTISPTSTLSEL
jgi:hypothetical protein